MTSNQSVMSIDGEQYMVGLTSFPDSYPINNITYLMTNTIGPYTIVVLSSISVMDVPSVTLTNFLDKFIYISNFSYSLCAIFTLLTVVSFTYIAAN
jgi:hypothetical protein